MGLRRGAPAADRDGHAALDLADDIARMPRVLSISYALHSGKL